MNLFFVKANLIVVYNVKEALLYGKERNAEFLSFWRLLLYNLRHYYKEPFKGFNGTIVASCNVICEPGLVLFETDDRMRQMKGRHALFWSVGRVRSKKC